MDLEAKDLCKLVEPQQEWEGERIKFDPDSSPETWEFYKEIYKGELLEEYDYKKLTILVWDIVKGKWRNKIKESDQDDLIARLFAIKKDVKPDPEFSNSECKYYGACLRLSGDTDFNFNEDKYKKIKEIIKGDNELIKLLEDCKKKHHSLQNFSLMQSLGGLQRIKSQGLEVESGSNKYEWMDRLDSFIYILSILFENPDSDILDLKKRKLYKSNYEKLHTDYLSKFDSIDDYCKRIYFIENELVNKLKENGAKHMLKEKDGKLIGDKGVVKEYLRLANEFWKQKQRNIQAIVSE